MDVPLSVEDYPLIDGLFLLLGGLFGLWLWISLFLSAQRGHWGWFFAILLTAFPALLYPFRLAADRRDEARTKAARQRRQEQGLRQTRKVRDLEREVTELKEGMG